MVRPLGSKLGAAVLAAAAPLSTRKNVVLKNQHDQSEKMKMAVVEIKRAF